MDSYLAPAILGVILLKEALLTKNLSSAPMAGKANPSLQGQWTTVCNRTMDNSLH